MYENYWGLHANPFESHCGPTFFYESETHQASLLKLRYLVENHKGAGLLVGGVGSGKSFVAQMLAHQLPEKYQPIVHLVFPQMPPAELLAYLAVELGADESAIGQGTSGLDRTVRQLQQLFMHYTQRGQHPLIIIDEADLIADQQVFEALRLLLNFQQQKQVEFTLLFSGQCDLIPRLGRMGQLEERLAVKCLLRSLTREETAGYVAHRLQAAGARQPVFEDGALDSLFELSGGLPRRVNRLCDLALLVGFADETRQISAEQIHAVAEELTGVAVE